MRRFKVSLTTAADGTVVGYTPRVAGEIHSIVYVKDPGANPFAAGVDFTITAEATGETLWTEADVNATKACYPRAPTHSTAGVAALYAAAGTMVGARPAIASDRVKISIAQGGNAKVGAFHVYID